MRLTQFAVQLLWLQLTSWLCEAVGDGRLLRFLAEKETLVRQLASDVRQIHQTNCLNSTRSSAIKTCLPFVCHANISSPTCSDKFGTPLLCKNGQCPGRLLDFHSSSISLSSIDIRTSLSEDQGSWTSGLDDSFKNTYVSNSRDIRWQYFATADGLMRIFPGYRNSTNCYQTDARVQPWFVSAASGPKQVVVLLDRTRTVSDSSVFFHTAVSATRGIITGLTSFDSIAVITLETVSGLLGSARGGGDDSLMLLKALDQITQVNIPTEAASSVLRSGFRLAFQMLTTGKLFTSKSAPRLVVLLTVSDVWFSRADTLEILSNINQLQTGLTDVGGGSRASILTFDLGKQVTMHELTKAIACENLGVWTQLLAKGFAFDPIVRYYQIISKLARNTSEPSPIWTGPHADPRGVGQLYTVSVAVIADSVCSGGDELNELVGVVAIDLPVAVLQEVDNSSLLANTIAARNSRPLSFIRSECSLDALRQQDPYESLNVLITHRANRRCHNGNFAACSSTVCRSLCRSPSSMKWCSSTELPSSCCDSCPTNQTGTPGKKSSDDSTTVRTVAIVLAVVGVILLYIIVRMKKERSESRRTERARSRMVAQAMAETNTGTVTFSLTPINQPSDFASDFPSEADTEIGSGARSRSHQGSLASPPPPGYNEAVLDRPTSPGTVDETPAEPQPPSYDAALRLSRRMS